MVVDLPFLARTLGALDLLPDFQVVAGRHLHGFPAPTSAVEVLGCHREALGAAVGPGRRPPEVDVDLLDRGTEIHLVSLSRLRVAERLLAADEEWIEAIHSPLVVCGEETLGAVRRLVRPVLSRRMARWYLQTVETAHEALETHLTKRVGPVLTIFRALLAGIHLLERGEVEPGLPRLLEVHDLPYLKAATARPTAPPWIGDPAMIGFLYSEEERLFELFSASLGRSALPEEPGPAPELEAFLAGPDGEEAAPATEDAG